MTAINDLFEKHYVLERLKILHYTYPQKEKLFQSIKIQKFKKGETVFDYGDPGGKLFTSL